MKFSSYHNKIQRWIKDGHLIHYEIGYKKIPIIYDEAKKIYKGKKVLSKVLILNFPWSKVFIREQYINEYIEFIENLDFE